jgi:hypothetical protein
MDEVRRYGIHIYININIYLNIYIYISPKRCNTSQWRTQEFFSWGGGFTPQIFFGVGSTNSVEDRVQRERGYGGGSPLVSGATQFANE